MNVEPVSAAHLDIIQGWWDSRGLGRMGPGILPPLDAVALDDDGAPLAAAWLYEPIGCKVVFLDWLVTRPGLSPRIARAACLAVANRLEEMALAGGRKMILASVSREGMSYELLGCGYSVAQDKCTHFVKHL